MATATGSALQAKIMTGITVDDLQASIGFYEGLGFVVEDRWEDNGTLNGVMLRAGDARLGLNQDDWKKGRDRKKGLGTRIFIETAQNVDEIAARAKQSGVKLDTEPHDTEWGEGGRAFEVTDPTGFVLTIMTASKP